MRLSPHRPAFAAAAAVALLFAAPTAIGSGNDERIVGGSPASPGEYPAHGYLAINLDGDPTFEGQCGGTLVARWQFLTAAHCVVDSTGTPFPPANFFVFMGDNDTNLPNSPDGFFDVTAVDLHAGYVALTHQNDLAMLTLDRPAPYAPLRVIRTDEGAKWAPGTTARIIGWGRTSSGGPSSNLLLEANAPMRADSTCQAPGSYGLAFFSDSMVCAGDGTTDTCQGDSGGPLMVPDGSALVLVGVTSWGIGCANPQYPGIYTRLGAPALNQWVMERLPRAAFSVGPAHSGVPTSFTQASFHAAPGGFTIFNWDFDNDGQFDDGSGPSAARTFGSGGTFTVGLEATGPGSDRAVTQQAVTVNGTPIAEAGGPYPIREGGAGSFAGSGTDPEGQALTFGWDLDRNGSFETPGSNPTISAARVDGPASLTVAFRACDTPGACSTDTATVRVTNVAPRVNAGPDRRARRRARVRVTGRITDPGPGERFRIAWTCGNGARGTGRTATCRYRRAGRFTIRFTVTDDDGGRGADSVRVRVR